MQRAWCYTEVFAANLMLSIRSEGFNATICPCKSLVGVRCMGFVHHVSNKVLLSGHPRKVLAREPMLGSYVRSDVMQTTTGWE